METIDQVEKTSHRSALFNVMSILSYIGNGIWTLLFLVLFIGCLSNGAAMMKNVSMDAVFGGVVAFFAILSALIILLCVVSMVGMAKMGKGKRSGFILYAISNGIWALLIFYAAAGDGGMGFIIGGLISLGFIVYFGSTFRKLN